MSRRRKLDMFTDADRARLVKLVMLPADQRPSNQALAARFSTTPDYIAKLTSDARAARKKSAGSVPAPAETRSANG